MPCYNQSPFEKATLHHSCGPVKPSLNIDLVCHNHIFYTAETVASKYREKEKECSVWSWVGVYDITRNYYALKA